LFIVFSCSKIGDNSPPDNLISPDQMSMVMLDIILMKNIKRESYNVLEKKDLLVANATELPFPDNSFDIVISINTVHNLDLENCGKALREIQRVSKKNSFITVDAFRNKEEEKLMYAWNLTAKTIMSVDDWIKFFSKNGYKGDYFWFIP